MAMVIVSFFVKPRTQLSLSYLSQSHQDGRSTAFFTISNAGNQSVTCERQGSLEISGQSTAEDVGFEAELLQLPPGDSETVQVHLPGTMDKPWRFTIHYGLASSSSYHGHQNRHVSSEWIKDSFTTAPALSSAAR